MEEHQDFENQHQQTCDYFSGSLNPFSSESFQGYTNTLNQSIQATTINGDGDNHQDNKIMNTSRFAPNPGSSSNTFTLSFGNPTLPPDTDPHMSHTFKDEEYMGLNEYHGSIEVPQLVSSKSRNRKQAQEHLFAERKRREKLSQLFLSLYALLPQHKKMDKATVLEDASTYIKELQERVKELEAAQVKGKHIQKSNVSVGITKPCGDLGFKGDASMSEARTLNSTSSSTDDPEIVVRISGTSILVRIYCERNPSLVLKALAELERLQLAFISSSVLPFSNNALVITITAKMSDELLMTATDLVKYLQSALRNFI